MSLLLSTKAKFVVRFVHNCWMIFDSSSGGWVDELLYETDEFKRQAFTLNNLPQKKKMAMMRKVNDEIYQADGNDRKAKLVALVRNTIAMIAIVRWQVDVEPMLAIIQAWTDGNEQSWQ